MVSRVTWGRTGAISSMSCSIALWSLNCEPPHCGQEQGDQRACRNQCFTATAAAAIPSNSAKVCGDSVN